MTDNPEDDYRVGPGRPPKHSRFKRGQSGNPTGRPKRQANLEAALQREMMAYVNVTEGGRNRRLTKQQVVAKTLTNNAIKGDLKAAALLLQAAKPPKEDVQGVQLELAEPDHEMIKRIRRRLSRHDPEAKS